MSDNPYPTWEKISVEEAEMKHMVKDERLGNEAIPFGFVNYQWIRLLNKMKKNDELYRYRSDYQSWAYLAGREGIALVRGKEIVAEIITCMN